MGIVEQKDADERQKAIRYVNTGIIYCRFDRLSELLSSVKKNPKSGEYYLTDIVHLANTKGYRVKCMIDQNWQSYQGVNDRKQLTQVQDWLLSQAVSDWQKAGVTIVQPGTFYADASVVIEQDVVIGPMVSLYGQTRVERGSEVYGPVSYRDQVVKRPGDSKAN